MPRRKRPTTDQEVVAKKARARGLTKKYTDEEVKHILEYMRDTILNGQEIEKPNAREYYKIMIEKLKLKDCVNTSLISKISAMKKKYDSAIKWREETGQGFEGESLSDKLNEICPNFEVVDEIYGTRIAFHPLYDSETGFENLHTGEPVINEVNDDQDVEDLDNVNVHSDLNEDEAEPLATNSAGVPVMTVQESSTAKKHEENKSILGEIATKKSGKVSDFIVATNAHKDIKLAEYAMEERKFDYNRHKLEAERALDGRKMDLEEKRVTIEEKKIEIDMKLAEAQVKKIEADIEFRADEMKRRMELKLRKLELESEMNLKIELAKLSK